MPIVLSLPMPLVLTGHVKVAKKERQEAQKIKQASKKNDKTKQAGQKKNAKSKQDKLDGKKNDKTKAAVLMKKPAANSLERAAKRQKQEQVTCMLMYQCAYRHCQAQRYTFPNAL